jgi:hypothetical protein
MSLLIKDCVDKLSNTINAVAQSEGKMNAKLYANNTGPFLSLGYSMKGKQHLVY